MKKILSIFIALSLFSPLSAMAAFGQYRSITVQTGQVPSTATNFPVLVNGNYSYLATVANGGKVQSGRGFDVGFYSNSDCATGKLAWEQVTWTPTNGNVEYYVNIASLADGSVFYMCYGDASITTDQSATTTTWNSNFKGVYHFNSGTTLSLLDSTTGANTLTNVNGVTTGASRTGTAAAFVAASQQYFTTATPWVTAMPNTMTAVFNATTIANNNRMVETSQSAANLVGYEIMVRTTSVLRATQGSTGSATDSSTFTTGSWNHASGRFLTTTDRSVRLNTNTSVQNVTSSTDNLAVQGTIGAFRTNGATSFPFDGFLDEVRISSVDLGVNWLTTENNSNATSTFYTIGAETPIGGAAVARPKLTLGNRLIIRLGRLILR